MRLRSFLEKLHIVPARKDPEPKRKRKGPYIVIPNERLSYDVAIPKLLAKYDRETAMSLAVGGDYEVMGELLRSRLEQFGLRDGDYLIDVGCGPGRLAYALSRSKFRETIRYLGVDIVPELLQFAAEKCQHQSWRFELAPGLKIPAPDGCADMVCFFSVFTHLMQEESFLYLREGQRVLKPGGKIVVSYLDILDPKHWEIFEANVNSAQTRQSKPMDIFLSEDFLNRWAEKLNLKILDDRAPDCGQRICVLEK